MIDYHSTDSSRDLIRRYCPTWEIHTTRNAYFDSAPVDREVEDFERGRVGWRMALNVTEFLYGNFAQLDYTARKTRHFVGNYVFVDPLDGQPLDPAKPLHLQRSFGYYEDDPLAIRKLDQGKRASRSLHNFAVRYPKIGGRHWKQPPSLPDLAIFYYGFACLDRDGIARKLQIADKISAAEKAELDPGHPNLATQDELARKIDQFHRPRCDDLSEEIRALAAHQYPDGA